MPAHRKEIIVMRRTLFMIMTLLLAVTLAAPVALAASPHFVGGVSFRDLGTTLRASGSIAGLGNENIDVQLSATGTASVVCINPGGNRAPGQDTTVNVSGTVSNLEVKNGRVNFSVTTTAPTVTSAACPNGKWTARVTDVSFTSATITVIQPAGSGTVVLTETFSP
jgi:hypothetical protein